MALASLCTNAEASEVVAWCERFELDLGHAPLDPAASLSVYKLHLAAYLICEALDDARLLWRRLGAALGPAREADGELCALWAIGKAMWVRDLAGAQAAMGAYAWSPPLLSCLIAQLQTAHLTASFDQCARAYSLISAEHLAATLGAPRPLPWSLMEKKTSR